MTDMGNPGRIIVTWGGYGSPGRTTVAITLARALGSMCGSALLIDADIYGADIGHQLSITGVPTLANAAHRCERRKSSSMFPSLATALAPGTDVLPGISHPGLWRDLESPQIQAVLSAAASTYHCTVVDTSPCIEEEERRAPRNGATRTVLSVADHILMVCRADPLGIRSFAGAFEELTDDLDVGISRVLVAVNRVPARSTARRMSRIQREITEISGLTPVAWLSEDPAVVSALWVGRSIQDHAPRARFVRQALDLAGHLGHLHDQEVSA